ncbi:MAG: FMN-binding protein [Propionibacteriaceae bacterium]|jgi:major membrane immunogen (membrane-anchored lipoprotein)|nr:FMN-binding protein [Propionibacteriaceae bacterium]
MSKVKIRHAQATLGLAALASLVGCSQGFDATLPLADGVFQAVSEPDEDGAVGSITITITDGAVIDAVFVMIQRDGTVKDESYGTGVDATVTNSEYYTKAQLAVAACEVYARQLVEVGDPGEVDVVAGATWAHGQFVEAAEEALRQAQQVASQSGK